ncbi:hypothetical protein MRB53_017987 [Persea americana]|uniref:Uncharacterized protein n=1 Tax=Persea americana TaxID=3435 RepID=A0ACC2M772_PERAE|nr:hypothetical protein MRB53_017987 [Persea americana]
MGSSAGTSEIIEVKEEVDMVQHLKGPISLSFKLRMNERAQKHLMPTSEHNSLEYDLDQLLEAIDLKTSRGLGPSRQVGARSLRKNTQKKPIRVGIPQASGIGISESVSLKQALRGLCISQASEMAAMKRLSKPSGLSSVSEAGTIKRLYRAVVVESGETGLPPSKGEQSLVEISFVPEKSTSTSLENATSSLQVSKSESLDPSTSFSPHCVYTKTLKLPKAKTSSRDVTEPASPGACKTSASETGTKENLDHASITNTSSKGSNSIGSPRKIKPIHRKKTSSKVKAKQGVKSVTRSLNTCAQVDSISDGHGTSKSCCHIDDCAQKNAKKESVFLASGSRNLNLKVSSSRHYVSSNSCKGKGECSQSSKSSSIGEYNSSTTSISEESNLTSSSCSGNRPHMSKDSKWEAIRHVETQHGSLGLKHFKLLKRLGCGDIGTVYLAELIGTKCLFALKVMDNDLLASRKKMVRAQTEREILQMLDHPFLPTLYSHFTTDGLSCLVMEYCPGGDLHFLRQMQPGKSFSEQIARFYASEVLLALEYLHMLGVVYRDLKPENILVREDGHIMLSDFDLSFRCAVNPTLLKSSFPGGGPAKRLSGHCTESGCTSPFCLQPSWVQMSCFSPRLILPASNTRKLKHDSVSQVSQLPQLVAEPTDARSNSFVGTHEYLAPEIIKGEGHGSAVDWWTFGIFLYELLVGRTPFKGSENEETLSNVVSQSLKFPEDPPIGFSAGDLISSLLEKDPANRLGSVTGATEIKQHPFFEGVNWALIRCALPPESPNIVDLGTSCGPTGRKETKCLQFRTNGEHLEFELF